MVVDESQTFSEVKNSLISRIGIFSAAIPLASLLVSVFYDWGFFLSIGISFAEAPTTIEDHLRSGLVWLPEMSLIILANLLLEMSTRRIERGMTEEEIIASAPDPQRTKKSRARPFHFSVVVAILGIIFWLLIGGPFAWYLFLGGAIMWFVISGWIFGHPLVYQRHSAWFRSIFHWAPPTLFFFFCMGFFSTQPIMFYETTHKLHIENAVDDTRSMNVSILRHFEKYLLVRNQGEITWIRADNVRAIEQIIEAPFFAGIVCYYRESWCPWPQLAQPAE